MPFYVGPPLARLLAERGHDVVLGDPDDELVAELEAGGTAVEVVRGSRDLAESGKASQRLADAAIERFGRIDSAVVFTGQIVTGRFMNSTPEQFSTVIDGCMMAPYHFMKAMLTPMIERGATANCW